MADPALVHVVDDEEPIRRSLEFLLRGAGYVATKWEDGETFLRGADPDMPACVLLDVRMPGRDGLEVQAAMARRGLNFPVIVLTGHGGVATAVKAMRAGAVDFLEKPFEREVLLRALDLGFAQLADASARRDRQSWAKTQIARLTAREQEVMEGLACGYPNKTIAYDLDISSRTVEVYRANAMAKLGVVSFADALRVAFAAGLGDEARWKTTYAVGVKRPGRD
ncbi:response regulator transcription factor [Parablastomonas sp. CN1-191]|uniref:response regulator transcription factor n=1 Tax=Parablastomonas sp. CN1-191 TaxID=3400908 RepID=UPI003BF83E25